MTTLRWWQTAVFYQIYPRSFADGNDDGIGDFPGITLKLDHLRDLGLDAVWLSPHFPSPQADCGYDITDYIGVAPEYGTLEDFTAFLHEAHARGIRVILDLVLNHTSIEHPWFQESRASRTSPKRDWYIWRDGKDGGPPNNWVSVFGGSAWELDVATGQYYYHFHLTEQPDLNWRNPEVKQAIWDAARFWLDLGVDGFRLDAVFTIFEHPDLPNHTATPSLADPLGLLMAMVGADEDVTRSAAADVPAMMAQDAVDGVLRPAQPRLDQQRAAREFELLLRYQRHQPGVHELMQELRELVDEYPGDRVLVGEADDVAYYGAGDDELHLVFNFPLMHTQRLTPAHIRSNQAERLAALPEGAWPCNTLGNHDAPRVWSRYGDGINDAALARVHGVLVLTLMGTPFLYYGEEIGMADLVLTDLHQIRDTAALIQYRQLTEVWGLSPAQAFQRVARMTRDRCRTPLQWADAPNGGFSPEGVTPWLPVNPNYAQGVNVADQEGDPASLLSFYRRLLALRRATPALVVGAYAPVDENAKEYLAFTRSTPDQTVLVALNFSDLPQTPTLSLPHPQARVLFSSTARRAQINDLARLELAPFEVYIAELQ
jgi:alpha-glucosidase